MPYDRRNYTAILHVQTSSEIPSLITKARDILDIPSQAAYVRLAVIERLARDLGVDVGEMLARQPNIDYRPKPHPVNARTEVE